MHDVRVVHRPGGTIAWAQHGPDDGNVVVGLHGTPGARHSVVPPVDLLHRLNFTYLTFDRPGYGSSPPRPGRDVASIADDVVAVAAAAGVDHFAVVGGSGGSAFALATAALHPDKVDSVSLIVPTAPLRGCPAMTTQDWFAGMNEEMARLHRLAVEGPDALRAALQDQVELADAAEGMVEDLVAVHREWGFDLREITAPVAIWFGVDDTNSPPAQARWLAAQLPDAKIYPQEGDQTWPAQRMPDIFIAVANM